MPLHRFQTLGNHLPAESSRIGILILLVLPLLIIGVREVLDPEIRAYPRADEAIIELELAQVPQHWPLTGAYSRFEFHHPGPAGTYLVIPAYYMAGGRSVGVNLGALLVNLLAIAFAAWALRPWSLPGLLAALVGGALTIRYLGSMVLTTAWGPYQSIALLVALLALMSRFRRAEIASWLMAVLIGGILIQIHVLYIPVLALALLVGVLAPGGAGLGWGRRGAAILAGLVVLLWLPLLLDVFRGEQSNALALWHFFTHPVATPDAPGRFALGAQAVSAWILAQTGALASPFPDAAHSEWALTSPAALWVAFLGQIAVAIWLGSRLFRQEGHRPGLRLVALAVVLMVWGLFAVLRIQGPAFPYILAWLTPVTAILWSAGLWWVMDWTWRRPRLRVGPVCLALTVAAVSLAGTLSDDGDQRARLPHFQGVQAAKIAETVLAEMPEIKEQGVHLARADRELWSLVSALLLQFGKLGVEATVSHDFALMIPSGYLDTLPRKTQLWLTTNADKKKELPLLAEVSGIFVRRITPASPFDHLAFGAGWDRPNDWGRTLRAREGRILARVPGPATLRLEISCTPEMRDGQDVTILENGQAVGSFRVERDAWTWEGAEFSLADLPAPGLRDIRFVCARNFPIADPRVKPVNLVIRNLSITAE